MTDVNGKELRAFEREISYSSLARQADMAYALAEGGRLDDALSEFRLVLDGYRLQDSANIWLEVFRLLFSFGPSRASTVPHIKIDHKPIRKVFAAGSGWSGSSAFFDYVRDFSPVSSIAGEFMLINGRYGLQGLLFREARSLKWDQVISQEKINPNDLRSSFRYCFLGITSCATRDQKKHAKNARLFVVNGGRDYAHAVHWFLSQIIESGFDRSQVAQLAEPFIDLCCRARVGSEPSVVALDNVLPAYRMEVVRYLPNSRVGVVIRDPRDQYVDNKVNNPNFKKSVDSFASWVKRVRMYIRRPLAEYSKIIRVVPFEDLILSESYRTELAHWLGLSDAQPRYQKFDPSSSSKNISLFVESPYFDEVKRLEDALPKEFLVGGLARLDSALDANGPASSPAYESSLLASDPGGSDPPNFVGGRLHKGNAEIHRKAKTWQALVYSKLGKFVQLQPPIDWAQDPFNNRSWMSLLHSLRFLGGFIDSGKRDLLIKAKDISLDWIRQHPHPDRAAPRYAWSDKIVGDRAQVLSYLYKLLLHRVLLEDRERSEFECALRLHGDILADNSRYRSNHNHGMAQDIGLYILSYYFDTDEKTPEWRALAWGRFLLQLETQISKDGVHLEHSPAYHFTVLSWLKQFNKCVSSTDSEHALILGGWIKRMERVSGWLVAPDASIPRVGDSSGGMAPKTARSMADELEGARCFDSGYGVVRKGGSYLFVTAGHHSSAHKQSDDTSFVLYEDNSPVILEAGRYGYERKGWQRNYVESPCGHNVLIVGEKPWDAKRSDESPYGSRIEIIAERDGWYIFRCSNPHLKSVGVRSHTRYYCYLPGSDLIVADFFESRERLSYESLVHFPEDARVKLEGDVRLSVENEGGHFVISAFPCELVSQRIYHGDDELPIKGWMATDYLELKPSPTLGVSREGKCGSVGLHLKIRSSEVEVKTALREGELFAIKYHDGRDSRNIVITPSGVEFSNESYSEKVSRLLRRFIRRLLRSTRSKGT